MHLYVQTEVTSLVPGHMEEEKHFPPLARSENEVRNVMLHTNASTAAGVLHVRGESFTEGHDPIGSRCLMGDTCTISGSLTAPPSPSCPNICFLLQSALRGCRAGSAGIVSGGGTMDRICWAVGTTPIISSLACRRRLRRAFLIAFQFCRNCRSNSLTSRPSTIPVCVCVCVCVREFVYACVCVCVCVRACV